MPALLFAFLLLYVFGTVSVVYGWRRERMNPLCLRNAGI